MNRTHKISDEDEVEEPVEDVTEVKTALKLRKEKAPRPSGLEASVLLG